MSDAELLAEYKSELAILIRKRDEITETYQEYELRNGDDSRKGVNVDYQKILNRIAFLRKAIQRLEDTIAGVKPKSKGFMLSKAWRV